MAENYENPIHTWCFRKSRSFSSDEKEEDTKKTCKEKNAEYCKQWRERNKEKIKEYSKNYRSIKKEIRFETVIKKEIQNIEKEIEELEKNEIMIKYKKLCERKECCLKLLED